MKQIRNLVLILAVLLISVISLEELNATVVNKSTKENVPSSLSSFYNRLTKSNIYSTDKFNCSSSGCTSYSNFDRNVGLLSYYEYDLIGGKNSYLYNANSYFMLVENEIEEMTSDGLNSETEESKIRASIYLKGETKVIGTGTINDPYKVVKMLEIEVENGRSNINVINLNNQNTTSAIITPNSGYTLKGATVNCSKGAMSSLDYETGRLDIKGIIENQTCTVSLNLAEYEVKLVNLNHVSATQTVKKATINDTVTFQLTADTNYSFANSSVACTNAVESVNSSGLLTISEITGDSECSISLGLDEYIVEVQNISNGKLKSGETGSKTVIRGGNVTFGLTANKYYTFEGASVICTNGLTGSISSSGVLTVKNVTSNSSCSVSLALTSHTVTVNVIKGSIIDGESTKTITHGENATFNLTANQYYDFKNSTITCTNGSGNLSEDGVLTISGLTGNSTCTVTLDYERNTISFDAEGGTGGQTADVLAIYGKAMPNIKKTPPKKTGYTFTGWYTKKTVLLIFTDYDKKYYNADGTSATTWDKHSDTTLYGTWLANEYTVSFNANGGTGGQSDPVTATYNSSMPTLSSDAPTKTGYTFEGWFDSKTGGNKYYKADGTSAKKWDKAKDATLYAQWSETKYTVAITDVTNGSVKSGEDSSKTVKSGSNVTFNIVPDTFYTLDEASVICANGSGSINSSGVLTVSNVKEDLTCTVDITSKYTCPSGGTLTNDSSKGIICVKDGSWDGYESYTYTDSSCYSNCCSQMQLIDNVDGCGGVSSTCESACQKTVPGMAWLYCPTGWEEYSGSSSSNLKCYKLATAPNSNLVTVNVTNGDLKSGEAKTKLIKNGGSVKFDLTANTYYTFSGATISCTTGSGSVNSSGVLTISGVTKETTCSVTLPLVNHTVTVTSVNNGSLAEGESSSKTVQHGTSAKFNITSPDFYEIFASNSTVSCTNGEGSITASSLTSGVLTVSGLTNDSTCTVNLYTKKFSYYCFSGNLINDPSLGYICVAKRYLCNGNWKTYKGNDCYTDPSIGY